MRRAAPAFAALGGVVWILAAAGAVRAHDPISADEAMGLVERISALQAETAPGSASRAAAACELGAKMERVVQVLNRDLASHEGELGMTATILADRLKARNVALSYWEKARRYRAYTAPLEVCAAIGPDAARRSEALFRLLRGRFYDSFLYNPLQPADLDWPRLERQIGDAERFLSQSPSPDEREEAEFILAVEYVRAARMAPNAGTARSFGDRARMALDTFARAYPDSMRTQAALVLKNAIPANE